MDEPQVSTDIPGGSQIQAFGAALSALQHAGSNGEAPVEPGAEASSPTLAGENTSTGVSELGLNEWQASDVDPSGDLTPFTSTGIFPDINLGPQPTGSDQQSGEDVAAEHADSNGEPDGAPAPAPSASANPTPSEEEAFREAHGIDGPILKFGSVNGASLAKYGAKPAKKPPANKKKDKKPSNGRGRQSSADASAGIQQWSL